MQRRTLSIAFLVSFGSSLAVAQTSPADAQAALKILEEKCAACHGAAGASGLDVRQREALLQGGKRGPAVKPGDADQSLLFQAASHQGELKMPPGSKTPLASEELAVLRKWI